MASIKEYNRKLASLKNTVKITKTMKMVSASKLKRAQDKQNSAKDYAREVNNLIFRIAGAVDQSVHPLLEPKPEVKRVLLLAFTSDKGPTRTCRFRQDGNGQKELPGRYRIPAFPRCE
jgi:F-type H+-transporting ATPase subunit gamma